MRTSLLLIAVLTGGIVLVVLAFIAALRKPDNEEAERIKRMDEDMTISSEDPNEPARFVP